MEGRLIGLAALILTSACTSGPPRVNPDRYRALILTIDSVAIRDAALRDDRRWAGTALRALGDALLTETSVDTSRRAEFDSLLRDLAGRTDGIGSDTQLNVAELEREWIKVRGLVFKPAGWFHQPSTQVVGPSRESAPPPGVEYPPVDPALDAVDEAVSGILVVAGRAEEVLRGKLPGSPGYQRTVVSLLDSVARLEQLVASAASDPDTNLVAARREALEALRHLRDYITTGADTLPGSPGRVALEKVAEHGVEARAALERVQ